MFSDICLCHISPAKCNLKGKKFKSPAVKHNPCVLFQQNPVFWISCATIQNRPFIRIRIIYFFVNNFFVVFHSFPIL